VARAENIAMKIKFIFEFAKKVEGGRRKLIRYRVWQKQNPISIYKKPIVNFFSRSAFSKPIGFL